MALLIDGYNVLHAEMPPPLAGLELAGLCRALARTRWVDGPIVVVCDGSPSPLGLTESPVPAVSLIFSGPSRTADEAIIERIERDSAPRRLRVVSSDHEIRQAARRRQARSQTSEKFLHALGRELTSAAKRELGPDKPGPGDVSAEEVQRWITHLAAEGLVGLPDTATPGEAVNEDASRPSGLPAREKPRQNSNSAASADSEPQRRDAGPPHAGDRSTSGSGEREPELNPEADPDVPWPPPDVERW